MLFYFFCYCKFLQKLLLFFIFYFDKNYFNIFMIRDVPECSGMFRVHAFIDCLTINTYTHALEHKVTIAWDRSTVSTILCRACMMVRNSVVSQNLLRAQGYKANLWCSRSASKSNQINAIYFYESRHTVRSVFLDCLRS